MYSLTSYYKTSIQVTIIRQETKQHPGQHPNAPHVLLPGYNHCSDFYTLTSLPFFIFTT